MISITCCKVISSLSAHVELFLVVLIFYGFFEIFKLLRWFMTTLSVKTNGKNFKKTKNKWLETIKIEENDGNCVVLTKQSAKTQTNYEQTVETEQTSTIDDELN